MKALILASSSLLLALASAAHAESSASSAVSDSTSSAAGGSSDSIEGSSNSSSHSSGDQHVAAGRYRVVAMTPMPERAGFVRVQLASEQPDQGFNLLLPQAAAERGQLAVGAAVQVSAQDYGYAFATAADGVPFFLVLDTAAQRGLQMHPVSAS